MAKLFAKKFDLDQLPDPKMPKQDIDQGGTTIDKLANSDLITNPNIRVEPVDTININTQQFNAKLRDIDTQKQTIATSDEILESQGVRKSSANQYVSTTKIEPFGDKPVEQGTANIKPITQLNDKVSPVDVIKLDQGSMVVDPKIEINPISQGSMITDPNTVINRIDVGDRVTNPETTIKLVDQGSKIIDPNVEIQKVKAGDRVTNPNTIINPIKQGERVTNPNLEISKVDIGDRTTNPNTIIQKVNQDEFIVNPNTIVNKIEVGDRIIDPNTKIKKVEEGDRIIDPNITINKIKDGDLIVDPKIKTVKVTADQLIVNPNIPIKKVKADELIVNPDVQLRKIQEIDPSKNVPNLYNGIGVTKFFPKTISLKDRLKQGNLGTTRHLPEYILSDQNTGYITISNPVVLSKVSLIDPQRISYQDTVLKQGGVEDLFKGVISYIDPLKAGIKVVNQGSVEITKKVKDIEILSLVEPVKLKIGDRTTDPKTEVQKIKSGDRTTDPKTAINKIKQGDRIVDPNTEVKYVDQGSKITDPKTEVQVVKPGDRITDPKLKIKPIVAGDRTKDPQLSIKPVVAGERTVNPKIKVNRIKPGERTFDPNTKVNKVKPGERTFNPNTVIVPVEPGERTFDPNTIIIPVEPGERTIIPYFPILPFNEFDDKIDFVQEPTIFENPYSTYPSDGIVPLQGEIITPAPIFNPTTVFPGDEDATGAQVPVFVGQVGVAYTNKYSYGANYLTDVVGNSAMKAAGESETPTLSTQYNNPSSTVIEQKPVVFPNAQFGDPNLPGGYRALNYGEIQSRRSNNPNKNLDFSYEDRSGVRPAKDLLGMPDKGGDTLNSSVDASANDFAIIKITSVRVGDATTLQFRSYLKNFSDTFTPTYTDVNYIGRPDTLRVFKGTTRQIGLSFIVPAVSKEELKVIYTKLETLVKIGTMGKKDGYYMTGPFLKLTVGGWCNNTPIIISSLKYDTNPAEYSWDIDEQVPQLVDVSLDCTVLGENGGETFLNTGTYIQYGGS